MMNRILVLITMLMFGLIHASAQELRSSDSTQPESRSTSSTEWSVNFIGSYGMHDVDFNSLPPVENCCLGFENSNGIGYGIQLGGSFPLSENGLRLSMRAGYQQLPVAYSSFSTSPVYLPGTGTVNAVFKHGLDVTFHTVPVHITLEYELTDWLWLGLGPDAYYIASSAFQQTETLENPSDLLFENGSRTRIDTTGSLSNYNSIVFNAHGSLRVRLGRDIGSIRSVDLLVGYSRPLTPVFDPQTWQGTAGSPVRSYFINRYNLSLLTAGIAVAL
jgi:hypothetical protein